MVWAGKYGSTSIRGGAYAFQYDGLNRLKLADYGSLSGSTITDQASLYNVTNITYDKNGNIRTLNRDGFSAGIDKLTYGYNTSSNQLKYVNDTGNDASGFKELGGNNSLEYYYDSNGNMIQDHNKKITTNITYNHFNLPIALTQNGTNISYLYDAEGNKLKSTVGSTVKNYDGQFIYEGSALRQILFSEGRIVVNGTSATYEFFMKDHLGNTRVTFNENGGLVQTLAYYPFGMEMTTDGNADNKFRYNGKEMQEGTDWYDYGARFYDPALARFHTQDRFAEKYLDFSPYQYAANNPIANIDINGDSIWFTQTDNAYTMHVSGKLINMSDNNVNMGKALKGIISQLQSTFSGEVDGMTFNTEVDLSVAETMDDVSESDHLFVLSEITNDKIGGAANDFGGKVAFLDADYFTGPFDATIGNVGEKLAAHEFGHLLNLRHFDGNTNIMRTKEQSRWYSFATSTTSRQLNQIMGSYNAGALNQGSPFGIMGLPNTGKVSSIIGLRQVEQKRRKTFNFPGIN
nr:RHS repeat-associated core domain-containing protein [uncultured Draconibacterium sp.]